MRPDNLFDLFEIDPAATVVPDSALAGPILKSGPLLVEFDETAPLDPGRATEELPAPAPVRRSRMLPLGLAGSLGLHLLPLVLLLSWNRAPAEIDRPIPVQLVIEQPPPPPPPLPPAPEEKRPPAGRLASVAMAETAQPSKSKPVPSPSPTKVAAPPLPTKVAPPPPPTKVAAPPLPTKVAPPPPTKVAALPPPPDLVSALPKPAPTPEPIAVPPLPTLAPPVRQPPKRAAVARLAPDRSPEQHIGRVPGPDATRDEYLAYCMRLLARYSELLPHSVLAGRSGVTVVRILVLADGTIARIAIKQSSGYPDIDRRAERMVAAVRRFPPLPQWFQGQRMSLDYHLAFNGSLPEH